MLYLTFHLWPSGGNLAGALHAPIRCPPIGWVLGQLSTALQAINRLAGPDPVAPAQSHATAVLITKCVLVGLGGFAVGTWAQSSALFPIPWSGRAAMRLLFGVHDLVFATLTGRRHDAVRWSSIILRSAGFAALTLDGLVHLLRQPGSTRQYGATEPALGDTEPANSLPVAERLLDQARALASCNTPGQVASTLRATVAAHTGTDLVYVGHRDPPDQPDLTVLAGPDGTELDRTEPDRTGKDRPGKDRGRGFRAGPFPLPLVAGPPLFLNSRAQIDRELPPPQRPPSAIRSLAVLPLRAGELLIGVLAVHRRHSREWTQSDRDLLTAVADQGGPVLSRARTAAHKHPAATTLHRSLLPPQLPTVPGLALAARYQAAGREELVGGDWYDGWSLADGRVALVIGDVVGKGLRAAATAGRLRANVRALAAGDPSPGRVLATLDRIEAEVGSAIVATVLYTLFDADLRSVRIARAGHPPPVLAHPEQAPLLLEEHGSTPIGLAAAPMAEYRVALRSGSTVVLYTDGLVEDRGLPIQDRLSDLLTTVGTQLTPDDPDPLATHLMARFRTSHEDDVALLVATCARGARPDPAATRC